MCSGLVWYLGLNLFFVWSGMQAILGNPSYQSSKFIKVFAEEPLPLMSTDPSIVWKGLIFVGLLAAIAFSIINPYLKGRRLRRGLTFGVVHWLLMAPWFEFYLPYNVMLEPIALVLLEGVLWFFVMVILGLFMSFTLNFKRTSV